MVVFHEDLHLLMFLLRVSHHILGLVGWTCGDGVYYNIDVQEALNFVLLSDEKAFFWLFFKICLFGSILDWIDFGIPLC